MGVVKNSQSKNSMQLAWCLFACLGLIVSLQARSIARNDFPERVETRRALQELDLQELVQLKDNNTVTTDATPTESATTTSTSATNDTATPMPTPATIYVTTCEGYTQTLSCASGVVSVISASYGRSDSTTCPSTSILTTNCTAPASLATVQLYCNGQTSCSFGASSGVFGDPCVDTFKYLTTTYECVTSTTPSKSYSAVMCENNNLFLSCPSSATVISISSANYGRTDGVTCTHSAIQTTSCSASSSLANAKSRCEEKNSCSVSATDSVFGDPCVNTYKYLNVTYTCVSPIPTSTPTPSPTPTASGYYSALACEGNSLTMSCVGGEVVSVTSATYGRSDSTTCFSASISNTSCSASASLNVVQAACNNQASCTVSASNSVFANPCGETPKYLTAVYTCVSPTPTSTPIPTPTPTINGTYSTVVCEGYTLSLTCPMGTSIAISSAFYGRLDKVTCVSTSMSSTTCNASGALSYVQNECNSKNECSVSASSTVLGNPCEGTYKYLEVIHTCT
eukprot:c12036_g2_i1.p1 GENE.c12036_g2_i1~~c12036_g2_i1.p1  ORF type:complete len:511 (+),score=136.14 c12036_g2_i1:1-1533(+)